MNTYTAGYASAPDGALTFSDIASTAAVTTDDERDAYGAGEEAEDAYLAALKTVTGYSISAGALFLFGGPYQNMSFERGTTSSSER